MLATIQLYGLFEVGTSSIAGTSIAITVSGYVRVWGEDTKNMISHAPTDNGYTYACITDEFACALKSNSSVHCWGIFLCVKRIFHTGYPRKEMRLAKF